MPLMINHLSAEPVEMVGTADALLPWSATPPPLALYVHLPWCVSKCPYCDFNSHQAAKVMPEKNYIRALLADAESLPPRVWGRAVRSMYVGGGTPSLFSPSALDDLLNGLRALCLLSPGAEITMEANPDSADIGKFAEFRALGVNRLSLGVQSFDDAALRVLGRAHNGAAAKRAAAAAVRVFDNVNLDLMYALPGQTAAMARAEVVKAASFAPSHLSLYQLTMEPGTPFFRAPPAALPDDDTAAEIADGVIAAAAEAGFGRYEISAYARPGRECWHNLNYWQFGDYAAIGAGAHSKITAGGVIWREERIKNPNDYMRRAEAGESVVAAHRRLAPRDAAFEFMLGALRLCGGFETAWLRERAGATVHMLEQEINSCEEDGLLSRGVNFIRPTEKGLRYLNDMLLRFLPNA